MRKRIRPKILDYNGLSMKDFENTEAALACADRLIVQNQAEYGHAGLSSIDPVMPLLSRFQYIKSDGKKRLWSQTEHQELEGRTQAKGPKQIQDLKLFMDAMGPGGAAVGAVEDSTVQIKGLGWEQVEDQCKALRKELLELNKYRDPLRGLVVKLKKKPEYENFSNELANIIEKLVIFTTAAEEAVFEFEATSEAEATL